MTLVRRRSAGGGHAAAAYLLVALGLGSAITVPLPPAEATTATPAGPILQPAIQLSLDWSTVEEEELSGTTQSFAAGDLPPTAADLPPFVLPMADPPVTTAKQPLSVAPKSWFVSPVPGPVTSGFGARFHPILHYVRRHNGVDMTAACGQPVVAAAAGLVTSVGPNGGYGNLVVIDHGMVQGSRLQTKYAHLSGFNVRVGDAVRPGTQIGLAGTTGLSTGCHLHFEVKVNGAYVDPAPLLAAAPTATPTLIRRTSTPTVLSASSIKARIRFCESSNNYLATNKTSTASGAYQFIDGTWRGIPTSVRGTATRAQFATPAQQDAAFDWLYARQGTTPWVSSQPCWGSRTTVPTATTLTAIPTTTATPGTTPTPSATATATPTVTATATPTVTAAPSPTATASPSATATASPSATASPTPTATESSSPSPTPTESATPTASAEPTVAPTTAAPPTATAAPSPSEAPPPPAAPSPTQEPSSTPAATVTAPAPTPTG